MSTAIVAHFVKTCTRIMSLKQYNHVWLKPIKALCFLNSQSEFLAKNIHQSLLLLFIVQTKIRHRVLQNKLHMSHE